MIGHPVREEVVNQRVESRGHQILRKRNPAQVVCRAPETVIGRRKRIVQATQAKLRRKVRLTPRRPHTLHLVNRTDGNEIGTGWRKILPVLATIRTERGDGCSGPGGNATIDRCWRCPCLYLRALALTARTSQLVFENFALRQQLHALKRTVSRPQPGGEIGSARTRLFQDLTRHPITGVTSGPSLMSDAGMGNRRLTVCLNREVLGADNAASVAASKAAMGFVALQAPETGAFGGLPDLERTGVDGWNDRPLRASSVVPGGAGPRRVGTGLDGHAAIHAAR